MIVPNHSCSATMLQRLINDQTAADDISANQLAGTQRFVFDSQQRRPPWLRGCTLRRLHGCPAAQDAPRDPPVGPTLVPVPQWWRYEVPLRLPDVTHWPVFETPLEAPRPASRSSYKKAKRPTAAPRACDLVSPSNVPLNYTSSSERPEGKLDTTCRQVPWAGAALDLDSPRQMPWSGAALASPPWALVLPAPNSPVTTRGSQYCRQRRWPHWVYTADP